MSELRKEQHPVTAGDLQRMFAQHQASYSPPKIDMALENATLDANGLRMSNMDREEVKARLEASEARVGTVVETMRADAAELRSELHTGIEQIKAQGVLAQASADKFYAQAGVLLADSKTLLAEIRQAGEKNRADMMGIGYKALTWVFGAALTLCGLYFTIKKAVTPPPAAPTTLSAPVPALPVQIQPPPAPSVPPAPPATKP